MNDISKKDAEIIASLEGKIWGALADYGRYTSKQIILEDFDEEGVREIAKRNYFAKQKLYNFLSQSPKFNKELGALVLDGVCPHTHNPELILELCCDILGDESYNSFPEDVRDDIICSLRWFVDPDALSDEQVQEAFDAMERIAPGAYKPGRKPSRVLNSIYTALGVADKAAGSRYQKLFAQLSDELNGRDMKFKLFVSINPAHFLTMSNPLGDSRGEVLISCHSLNRTDYQYNNGCVGYACDETSLIAFTVSNPDNPELLNNRKLSRFMLFFDPDEGFVVQSRLYDTKGGTRGEQEMSDVYINIILEEFSRIMGIKNDWNIAGFFDAYGYGDEDYDDYLDPDEDFGGYPDWRYDDFNARVCLPVTHKNFGNFTPIRVGSSGICAHCGTPISAYMLCTGCCEDLCKCRCCGETFNRSDIRLVGDEETVCDECFDEYYRECEECGEYHHEDDMWRTYDGDWYCESCHDECCAECADCDDVYSNNDLYTVYDADGNEIRVCQSCRDYGYSSCDLCATYNADERLERTGDGYDACPSCRENKCSQCGDCGRYFYRQNLVGVWDDGDLLDVCEDCAKEYESEEDDEEIDRFADGE